MILKHLSRLNVIPPFQSTSGANAGVLPDWEGAKSYSFLGYPSVSLRRADAREWSSPDDGLDFSVYDAHGFSVGPVAAYELGRYRNDDPRRLFGIHDVPWMIEGGVFAEFWAIPDTFRARIEIRHGLGSGNGFVADAAVDYLLHFGAATFALGPRLSLGDQDFMRRQFEAGILLCLCSKNNDADVVRTFELHPEMPLRLEDFIAELEARAGSK